ncbi:MAG: ABC transporter substrate-binding protein [Acidisphaera sp.]|nr:ABC transporter substrate-binding protein [Acidisphaera sp.]MBV9813830.1 ABC transporter substrate-binding protein [Acetobacteraceae bacterium]
MLKVVPSADVAELDPTRAANQIGRIYAQMVFDSLFALDHTLSPKPMMVQSETVSPDKLTYTFTLRPGLKFTDGGPVTSRDVVASLRHWMDGGSVGQQLKSRLASLTAVDDSTVSLTLNKPFGLVEFVLAGAGAPMAAIMREADANRPAGTPLTNPIGSGPFIYDAGQRVSGQRVVFDRNPDYPARPEPPDGAAGGRVVKVDRVEWDILPDPTTTANAMVRGEVDFWDTVTPDLAPFLKQHGIVVRRTASLPAVVWLRPNFELPPFDNVKARQALALLFDQKDFMEAVAGPNGWSECYSFSVCGSVLGTEVGSEPYRTPDPARAKQLLAEAGYKGEPIVVVGTPQLPVIDTVSQIMAQRLRDIGANVDLQMGDWADVFKRVNTPHQTMGHGGWNLVGTYSLGGTWFNPLTNVALDSTCGETASSSMGRPCDPEGEALRQAVLAAPDDASRKAAFETFQRHAWQFIPYVPGGQFDINNAYRSNISGVLDGYVISYWNISKG